MPAMNRARFVFAPLALLVAACNGGTTSTADGSHADAIASMDSIGGDAARPDGSPIEVASETRADAVTCANPDMDGDGHMAIACGGDDCDDNDPNRYPGNVEVCHYDMTVPMTFRTDPTHDEDCDPTTYANPTTRDGDHDGDGYVDHVCSNIDRSGNLYHGPDCADTAPVAAVPASLGTAVQPQSIHPTAVEICNGVDDNCDGVIDEGDPGGGGMCGLTAPNVCRQGVNHCVMGAITCVGDYTTPGYCCAGFADCNHDIRDGCEANLAADPLNCSACGTSCPTTGGTPVCNAGVCGYNTCSAGLMLCSGTCVNERADIHNCNGCGHVCPSTSGTPSCVGGVCGYSACGTGLTLCGTSCVALQTDPNNCGACGHVCPVVAGGTAACVAGACAASCAPGLTACGPSCVNVATDVLNCGQCGHACSNAGATFASCSGGHCMPSCGTGHVDCSTPASPAPDDGCECVGTACCGPACQRTWTDGAGESYHSCTCDPNAACAAYAAAHGGFCTTTPPAAVCMSDCSYGGGCGTPFYAGCSVYSTDTAGTACHCWQSNGTYMTTNTDTSVGCTGCWIRYGYGLPSSC
jgi:hypothetical protein